MIIVRILKATDRKETIADLVNLGYKKDKVHSMTSKANYIYVHDDVFEIVNTFRYNELINKGVFDCKLNADLFYSRAYDLKTYNDNNNNYE